jgi:hypothetical protein
MISNVQKWWSPDHFFFYCLAMIRGKGSHNLGAKQRLILDYLKRGYYIKQVHDVFTMELWIDLTDEDGDDIMSVPPRTVRSLVERGLVTKSDWWPCLQINIIEFRLKPSI